MADSGNNLVKAGIQELKKYLPEDLWSLDLIDCNNMAEIVIKRLKITPPDGEFCILNIVSRARVQPRDVITISSMCKQMPCENFLIISPFLSADTRSRLVVEGLNYIDLTGNLSIRTIKPVIWIQVSGASQNPNRREQSSRSLKGAKAARIVQVLVDTHEKPGVRDLASEAETDVGYVSRILKFLDEQALITRGERNRLESIDWESLLRRLAADSPLESRGEIRTFIEPRGLDELIRKLRSVEFRYAVTGSFVATRCGPIAPARLAMIYVMDINDAASELNLKQVDSGINVLLIKPFDDWIFSRSESVNTICYASFSQAVVDLLSSPGRAPAEAEELIKWMKEREELWRG